MFGFSPVRRRFGSASSFDPSSLNLDLDLRTPNYALDASTRASNGLIVFDDPPDTGNPDISRIVDNSGNGYHADFTPVATMSHWNNTNYRADFDGTDDMPNSLNGFEAAVLGDTAGEFVIRFYDSLPGGFNRILAFWQNGDDTNDRWVLRLAPDDKIELIVSVGGVNNVVEFSTSAETRKALNTIFIGGDGANYYMDFNGSTYTAQSGTDNGNMQGANAALDTFGIFKRGSSFYANSLYYLGYKSGRVLTPAERSNMKTWLNENIAS